jgi:hypothetical protein
MGLSMAKTINIRSNKDSNVHRATLLLPGALIGLIKIEVFLDTAKCYIELSLQRYKANGAYYHDDTWIKLFLSLIFLFDF